jgi:hypothetical protein
MPKRNGFSIDCPSPTETREGYCQCGCGKKTPLAKSTARSRGTQKDVPLLYIHGHNRRRNWQDRFWEKVEKTEGCWFWKGSTNDGGYGTFHLDRGSTLASRVSYVLNVGPIPAGKEILHTCDNPPCVRPDHLVPGTHQDNFDDATNKNRTSRWKKARLLGERNHQAKLNDTSVREMRVLAAAGWGPTRLARRFRVHRKTARRVLTYESWKHLD